MIGFRVLRRPSNAVALAAFVLCCLAVGLPTANGPFNAPGIAIAAESDEAPSEKSESPDPAKDDPAQSEASKNGDNGPPGDQADEAADDEPEEVFVPSEDISEDIDVPFPVDI